MSAKKSVSMNPRDIIGLSREAAEDLRADVDRKNKRLTILERSNSSLDMQVKKLRNDLISRTEEIHELREKASKVDKLTKKLGIAQRRVDELESLLSARNGTNGEEATPGKRKLSQGSLEGSTQKAARSVASESGSEQPVQPRRSNCDSYEQWKSDASPDPEWEMVEDIKPVVAAVPAAPAAAATSAVKARKTAPAKVTPSPSGKRRGRPPKAAAGSTPAAKVNKEKPASSEESEEDEDIGDKSSSSEYEESEGESEGEERKTPTPKKVNRVDRTVPLSSGMVVDKVVDAVADPTPFEGFTRASNRKPVDYTMEKVLPAVADSVASSSKASDVKAKPRHSTGSTTATGGLEASCRELVDAVDQDTLIRLLNKMLARFIKGNPSVQVMLAERVDSKLVSLLDVTNNDELLHRALIILNNLIARTEPDQFKQILSRNKFIAKLVALASSHPKEGVQEQAVWIMDNIAIDGTVYRNRCVELGMLGAVIKCLTKSQEKPVLVIASKALGTLSAKSHFKLPTGEADIKTILVACETMLGRNDKHGTDVTANCCAALFNLTENEDNDVIQLVMERRPLVRHLVDCLGHHSASVKLHAVQALANLAAAKVDSDDQQMELLGYKIIPALKRMLQNEGTHIVAGACRVLANIMSGLEQDIAAVERAGLVAVLITNALTTKHTLTAVYSTYAIVCCFHGCSLEQAKYLVDHDALRVALRALTMDDSKLVLETLKSLKALLRKFDFQSDFEYVSELLDEEDGWEKIKECGEAHAEMAEKDARSSRSAGGGGGGGADEETMVLKKIRKAAGELTKDNLLAYYQGQERRRAALKSTVV